MIWTKIPTDLLKQRIPDNEIVAIVKYQLLWADLEYQPDDKTALRYITNKQLLIVRHWLNTIEAQVTSDIKSVNKNRNKRKISYRKINVLGKKVTDTLPDTVPCSVTGSVEEVDKIRTDKIRLDKNKKENNKKKKAINEDWKPKPETVAKLREKNLSVDLVIEKFINSCLANNYKYVDFDRAILSWNWDNDKSVQQKLNYNDEGVPY